MKRRNFIKDVGLISTSLFAPSFLACNTSKSRSSKKREGKNIVVIQLSGGNDGFNCFFPSRMDDYYKLRPTIALQKNEIESLNKEYAINKSLSPFKKYFDRGEMCLLNRIGYPNPSLSHFRSMDVWQSGQTIMRNQKTGWLGKYLDKECADVICEQGINLEDGLSLALKGSKTKGIAIGQNPLLTQKMYASIPAAKNKIVTSVSNNDLAYLYKLQSNSTEIIRKISNEIKGKRISSGFQNDLFSRKLGNITKMILSDLPAKIFYVEIKGFDTHSNQKKRQNKLLSSLSFGIDQLIAELKTHGLFEDTLIFIFSEFGRRLKENQSKGTDHGTGNCSLVFGSDLKSEGIYNDMFSTGSIAEKNLSFEIDFRSVYATILDKWLQVDSREILGKAYPNLNFL